MIEGLEAGSEDAGVVLFASDTHLAVADPGGIERFVAFVDGLGREADRLVLVGDLFDVWVSPSQADQPLIRRVLDTLRACVEAGVDVGFVEGNRDFAATPELRRVGVRPLADTETVVSGGRRVVFTHGDLLCTQDVRYQAFRRVARTSAVRGLLRSIPDRVADGLGKGARAGSRLETARKAYGDMGLDANATAALLRAHDADALVCGHVHWGQRFTLEVDGTERDVVVLSAWDERPSYARLADGELTFSWLD